MGVELEEALGVKVDIGTPESLRERLRDEVLAEAVPL
jgi:predicted nucleotidyltransferase